jgi:perosamine synthetase
MNLPLFKIYWDEKDIKYVKNKIRSGQYWCTGKENEVFEKKITEYLDIPYCISLNSGGSALHALMIAYDFGPGDEIIVPSFTFIATAYSPLYTGAKPCFVDIEDSQYGLDPDLVNEAITSKTKAILPIHFSGIPCKINKLKEIAEDNNIVLIEDAAEAFGAKIENNRVGTIGDSSIFSFCHNKIFTTSEGGCIVTHNKKIYDRISKILSYGRISEGNYFTTNKGIDYVAVGYNWRLSSILAALGIAQIEKVDKIIKMRRNLASKFNKNLEKIPDISPIELTEKLFGVYQMYNILLEDEISRNRLIGYLNKNEIYSKIYFEPVHKYSIFRNIGFRDLDLPITEDVSSRILAIPFYPHMTDEEMNYLFTKLRNFSEV